MNIKQLRQEEHQKYFFGITSSEVYYTLEESLKKCVEEFMEQIEETLEEENVSSKEGIEKEVVEIKALYMSGCMKVLMDFKNVLNNIFEIPETAPIYPESKKKCYTDDEICELRERVTCLNQTHFSEKMFLGNMNREKQVLEKLRPLFVDTKIILDELKNKTDSNKIDKLMKIHQKQEEYLRNSYHDVKIDQFPELGSDLGV